VGEFWLMVYGVSYVFFECVCEMFEDWVVEVVVNLLDRSVMQKECKVVDFVGFVDDDF